MVVRRRRNRPPDREDVQDSEAPSTVLYQGQPISEPMEDITSEMPFGGRSSKVGALGDLQHNIQSGSNNKPDVNDRSSNERISSSRQASGLDNNSTQTFFSWKDKSVIMFENAHNLIMNGCSFTQSSSSICCHEVEEELRKYAVENAILRREVLWMKRVGAGVVLFDWGGTHRYFAKCKN
ncbi:hypothetical protein CPC08DRAFT_751982 [Agrocybe pediades]|nr:hypothetical protein CPC08DRAFT_751982 [Agrocybe pediades]